MHRYGTVAVVFVLAGEAILGGVEVRAQTLAFVPTGSTGAFEVIGTEIIIPLGGVQVELEVVLSGWGDSPGRPTLGAYNATLVGTSLEGVNASPPNPGVDLTTPNGVDCPGDDAALCPAPSPDPVTVTGGCGTFDKDKCDDFQGGFVIVSRCFADPSVICAVAADCSGQVPALCVEDSAYVFGGQGLAPVVAVSIPANNNIEWIGAASSGGSEDGEGHTSGGFLRLIVPTDSRGTYTIQWNQDGEKSFFNGEGFLNMHITLVDGLVTIIGDCNDNGVVDDEDIARGTSKDCNDNTFPDECDIADGISDDCNSNGVPDECDPVVGTAPDCNGNDIPDDCDIADGFSEDCNENDVPDECDLADGTSRDCTANGVPDECEVDCNDNRVADSCDIANGTSNDCNGNGVPDECDATGETGRGAPTIEFVPTGSGGPFALGCNEIIIPRGGVQVELEVVLSGWGEAPGNPPLKSYNATMEGDSLLGVNADPPAPGIDLTTPDGVDCSGENASLCPDPSPPPVTMTGTCGIFEPGKCDDLQAGFIILNRCLGAESIICGSNADCSVAPNLCVPDPAFALEGTGPVTAVSIPDNNNIEWIGAASSGGADDDGTPKSGGFLRLIVPTDARGTYTIRWDPDNTKTNWPPDDGIIIPGSRIIAGQVTIASGCCFEDASCKNLTESDCALAGGTSLSDLCGDFSDGLSCRNFARKNRYISFMPDAGSEPVAYRVDLIESELFPESVGLSWWVDVPNADGIARLTNEPVFRDWSGDRPLIDVGDCPIVPASVYEILATTDGSVFAEPLVLPTVPKPEGKTWGDIAGQRTGFFWDPPDGSVNVIDVVAALRTFTKDPRAPLVTWSDLDGARPNGFVNVTDIQLIILAFLDRPYPFSAPADCP